MTSCYFELIVGRPFSDMADRSEEGIAEDFGLDEIEGLECLYQGDSFIGVRVRGIVGQGGPKAVTALDFSIPQDKLDEAKRLCDALPEAVANHPGLLPFGAYLVSSDG